MVEQNDDRTDSLFLKIDIEQDEWPVLARASHEDVKIFRQVVGEFHGFDFIIDEACYEQVLHELSMMNENYFLYHVYANNYAPLMNYDGVFIPAVLELSYANRALYEPVEEHEIFPSQLDQPCNPELPDYMLGCFWY